MTNGKLRQRAFFCKKECVGGGGYRLESLMKVGGQVSRGRSSKEGLCDCPEMLGFRKKMLSQNPTGGDKTMTP